MAVLSEWITNIILFILLATIIDLLLPNSSMQKYAKMVVGLLLIVIILTPLFKILTADLDQVFSSMNLQPKHEEKTMENLIESKKTEIQATQRAYILEQMAVQMKTEVESELMQEYGLEIQEVQLTLDEDSQTLDDLENIQRIHVLLTNTESEKETVVTAIKQVTIDTSQPLKEKPTDDLTPRVTEYLAKKWEIEPENLAVMLEGRSE